MSQKEKKQIRTHLVHALASVPMQERLPTEHDGELLGDALPGLLDGGGVANKGIYRYDSTGTTMVLYSYNCNDS